MIITAPAGRDTLVRLSQALFASNPDSVVPDLLNENIRHCPEADLFEAIVIEGTGYPSLVRTGFPTAQFRQYNQGVPATAGTYRTAEVQTAIVSTRVEVDRAYAKRYPGGEPAWKAVKSSEALEAILRLHGSTTYYGHQQDANGFPGLWELVDPSMVKDLGGAVQADGFRSSVWAVKTGAQDVRHVYGLNETLGFPSEWRVTDIAPDPAKPNDKHEGLVNYWGGRPGLAVATKNSVACIKNVTSDPAHPLRMSDLRDLLDMFPVGVRPDYIFWTRRASGVTRNSLKTALVLDPPTPEDIEGIPLVPTDSISNAEGAIYA